jgi:hypothetical protein
MTRVTIQGPAVLLMATDAESHVQRLFLLDTRLLLHVSVTSLAGKTFCNVRSVIEINKIRLHMHLDPFHGLVLVVMFFDLLNVGAVGLYYGVAVHADIQAGNPGMAALVGVDMAIKARDLIVTRMDFMAEGNGLFRGISDTVAQIPPKTKYPTDDGENDHGNDDDQRFGFHKSIGSLRQETPGPLAS